MVLIKGLWPHTALRKVSKILSRDNNITLGSVTGVKNRLTVIKQILNSSTNLTYNLILVRFDLPTLLSRVKLEHLLDKNHLNKFKWLTDKELAPLREYSRKSIVSNRKFLLSKVKVNPSLIRDSYLNLTPSGMRTRSPIYSLLYNKVSTSVGITLLKIIGSLIKPNRQWATNLYIISSYRIIPLINIFSRITNIHYFNIFNSSYLGYDINEHSGLLYNESIISSLSFSKQIKSFKSTSPTGLFEEKVITLVPFNLPLILISRVDLLPGVIGGSFLKVELIKEINLRNEDISLIIKLITEYLILHANLNYINVLANSDSIHYMFSIYIDFLLTTTLNPLSLNKPTLDLDYPLNRDF